MVIDNKLILDDPALSAYVKRISHGNMSYSRKLFPYVEVGNFHITRVEIVGGGVDLHYAIEITAGTRSLAHGLAYKGDGADRKGISDLCDDVRSLILNNTFGGVFEPVVKIKCDPNYRMDSAGTLHVGSIVFHAAHWTLL